MTTDGIRLLMQRYYGGKQEFLRVALINKKRLSQKDVDDILNDAGNGCMDGVARYREFLQLLGKDIKIVDAK